MQTKEQHPLFRNAGLYIPHVVGMCECGRITRLRSCYFCHKLMCIECLLEHSKPPLNRGEGVKMANEVIEQLKLVYRFLSTEMKRTGVDKDALLITIKAMLYDIISGGSK